MRRINGETVIASLIARVQKWDGKAIEEIFILFAPMLQKYNRLLKDEDGASQMRVFFLDTLHKISLVRMKNLEDPVLIRYIQYSLYHEYVRLKKSAQFYLNRHFAFTALSEKDLRTTETLLSAEDNYFTDIFPAADAGLTDKETFVLQKIFLEGFSVSEVAANSGISRQAVNQAKLRALNKLHRN